VAFSDDPSASLHRRFIIVSTDQDTSVGFFHRRFASRILSPYNRLHVIHQTPMTSVAEYYTHLLPARIAAMSLDRAAASLPVSLAVAYISLSPVHQRLCCALSAAPSSAHGLCHVQVFFADIDPRHCCCTLCMPLGWRCLFPHYFFFVQHNHSWLVPLSLVCPILATLERAFVPNQLMGLANPAHVSVKAA
jgi:hypothetical protein